MKLPTMKYTVLTVATTLISVIIFLLPFHAFLTVWGASLFGHYITLRLWKEVLLVVIFLAVCFLLLTDHKIRSHTMSRRLIWVTLTYCLVITICGLLSYWSGEVKPKAFGYGMISDLRFPVFFLLTWAVAVRTNRLRNRSQKLILWPAAIVIIFGLLQVLVLPREFLSHFGYSEATIYPYETINHNVNYIRIASTLRGANPLGAYLLIPISLLVGLLMTKKNRLRTAIFLTAALAVLFFSFSRGAWVGAVFSIATVLIVKLRNVMLRKEFLLASLALLIVLIGVGLTVHKSSRLENIVLHTESHSRIKTTSNEGHVSATISGLKEVSKHPLGQGVGSSGPASVYNKQTRIPENYYLQIGEEAGWLGLMLFLLMNAGVGFLLWLRRGDTLALSLFASLIGISIVNLFSQAWSDDTLAYVWWGLAGIAMVGVPEKILNARKK